MVVVRCIEDDRRLVNDLVPCGTSSGVKDSPAAAVSLASSNASYICNKKVSMVAGNYQIVLEGVV